MQKGSDSLANQKNLIGQRYGKLTVAERAGVNKHNQSMWICVCDCGTITKPILISDLRSKGRQSCGCTHKQKGHITHGMKRTRLYNIWSSMKTRCNNPNSRKYKDYGGRGITICDEWMRFEPFHDWAIASGYDPNAKFGECTLDRIDVNGNYEPSNCRWADMKTQQNNKRNNHHECGQSVAS